MEQDWISVSFGHEKKAEGPSCSMSIIVYMNVYNYIETTLSCGPDLFVGETNLTEHGEAIY